MSALPEYGPALRKHLVAQLADAVQQYRDTLHPEDAQMAEMEFRSWAKACDTKDQATVDHFVSFSLPSVRAADVKGGQLRAIRLPHAIYAAAALKARFGIDRTKEIPL